MQSYRHKSRDTKIMCSVVGTGVSAVKGSGVTVAEVPLRREVVELARARGVDPKELAEAAKKLLILEIIAMESKLSMRDALELSKEVTRKAWEKLEKEKASDNI